MDKKFRVRRRALRILRDAAFRKYLYVSPVWLLVFGVACLFGGAGVSVLWMGAIAQAVSSGALHF